MTLPELLKLLRESLIDSVFTGKCYLVGGTVRDHLLGKTDFTDIDITVELPEGGIRLAQYLAGIWQVEELKISGKFGTASFVYQGCNFDFACTRKEHYRKGSRYPFISFGTLYEDVYRRDFSINSLMLDIASGEILDLSGKGLADLQAGIIRSLKDPAISMQEDPLRILRARRFARRFGFKIEPDLAQAMDEYEHLVEKLSKKRVEAELQKM